MACASAELVIPVRLHLDILVVLSRLVFNVFIRRVFALSPQKHVRPSSGSGSALAPESVSAFDAISISSSKSSSSADPARSGLLGLASSHARGRIIHRVCFAVDSISIPRGDWLKFSTCTHFRSQANDLVRHEHLDGIFVISGAAARVKRGPSWKWDSQDGGDGHVGIIAPRESQTKEPGWVTVLWTDASVKRGSYRAARGTFDLVYADDFCGD